MSAAASEVLMTFEHVVGALVLRLMESGETVTLQITNNGTDGEPRFAVSCGKVSATHARELLDALNFVVANQPAKDKVNP
jgi:hypothetical protein